VGGKRQQKSVGGIHKSHKRINDSSKELNPYTGDSRNPEPDGPTTTK
jgi:hypothetical protein